MTQVIPLHNFENKFFRDTPRIGLDISEYKRLVSNDLFINKMVKYIFKPHGKQKRTIFFILDIKNHEIYNECKQYISGKKLVCDQFILHETMKTYAALSIYCKLVYLLLETPHEVNATFKTLFGSPFVLLLYIYTIV